MSAPTSNLTPTSSTPMSPSPSTMPDLALLPNPPAADKLPVGLLVSKDWELDPSELFDCDYEDVVCKQYSDSVFMSVNPNPMQTSISGIHRYHEAFPEPDTEMYRIEAEEMRVRSLKDPHAALSKRLTTGDTKLWIKEQIQEGKVGFVTAVREVTNARYERTTLNDLGYGNWELLREVSGAGTDGNRSDSGQDVQTGSKRDAISVIVRHVGVDGDDITLGDQLMVPTKFFGGRGLLFCQKPWRR